MNKFIAKVRYGLLKLHDELIGKEDYWHLKLRSRKSFDWYYCYYHDIRSKGAYPGKFNNGIPILNLNFIDVEFHITTLNYGLGLIDDYYFSHQPKELYTKIEKICFYLINELDTDGSLRYKMSEKTNHFLARNKASGMTQGLLLSFLIRCRRIGIGQDLINYHKVCKNILNFLLSDEIINSFKNAEGNKIMIIEEFYVPGSSILNGAIFGIYGVIDFEKEFLDGNSIYSNDLLNSIITIINRYSFCKIWSYYDLNKTFSSAFYHDLHINMLNVLYELTANERLLNYKKYWLYGQKFKFIFIFLKGIQKLKNINQMPLSNI